MKAPIPVLNPYFAHDYEGLMLFWTAAMAFEGTKRLKALFN